MPARVNGFAVLSHSDQLDLRLELPVAARRLGREDSQHRSGLPVDADALEDSQIVEAMQFESGVAMDRAVSQPFHDHRDRQHGFAADDVRFQERVLHHIQQPLERRLDLIRLGRFNLTDFTEDPRGTGPGRRRFAEWTGWRRTRQ